MPDRKHISASLKRVLKQSIIIIQYYDILFPSFFSLSALLGTRHTLSVQHHTCCIQLHLCFHLHVTQYHVMSNQVSQYDRNSHEKCGYYVNCLFSFSCQMVITTGC